MTSLQPTFLIIGGQKCGTTALFEYLAKHPEIVATDLKEVDFFGCDFRYERGLDFYRSHFPSSEGNGGKVTFDASPQYLVSDDAPRRIYDCFPEMRMIVLLRDPVKRAFSAWTMYKKFYAGAADWFCGWMDRCYGECSKDMYVRRNLAKFDSFEFVLKEELDLLEEGKMVESPILYLGRYSEHLGRYLDVFDREQILIIENEFMRSDLVDVLGQIEDFVGVRNHDWGREQLSPVFEGKGDFSEISEEALKILKDYYGSLNEDLFRLIVKSYDWL